MYLKKDKQEKDISEKQSVLMVIIILGILIMAMLLLKPDKPMSCEEFKEMETFDPRISSMTTYPWYINPCDITKTK